MGTQGNATKSQGWHWAVLPAVVLLVLYTLGYGFFRSSHQIIHRIAGVDGTYTLHAIEGGDAALLGAVINAEIAAFYTPLRWLELAYWNVMHPVGSPMTRTHLQRWQ
jgi:hypothetical protein